MISPPSPPPLLFLFRSGPENWIVYKAWWGNKPSMAKADVSGVAGVNSFNSLHPVSAYIPYVPYDIIYLPTCVRTYHNPFLIICFNYCIVQCTEKTLCVWTASHPNRSGSGPSTSRIGTCIPKVRRRSWCYMYRAYQYYFCLC